MQTNRVLSLAAAATAGLFSLGLGSLAAGPRWVISANESKIHLSSGTRRILTDAPPDTVTLLDFESYPPRVTHLTNISNTVLGPPSNVAVSSDGRFALIADSIRLDASSTNGFRPARRVHVLDLTTQPPRRAGEGEAGEQPSGVSIAPDNRLALVANRAGGSVSVLRIDGLQLRSLKEIPLAGAADEVSDVAIAPNGRRAFVSVREKSHLRELRIDGDAVTATDRKISTYGRPYRVLVTPDSELVLTAGEGAGSGGDTDALTVVDLSGPLPHSRHYVELGSAPESLELSPDGRWLIAVLMNGSHLPPSDPARGEQGQIALLERSGGTYVLRDRIAVGRIPEGGVFAPDGRHVVIQVHSEHRLWVLERRGARLKDTGLRIDVPGMPSGMRAQR
jgi:DNA-binding beta-propeller fold protein YncE